MTKRNEVVVHPQTADLDRLRAGLLDDAPAAREALLAHLQSCSECQARSALWPRVSAALQPAAADGHVGGMLAARRQRALRGQGATRRKPPAVAFAVAAAIAAIAIGVSTLLHEPDFSETPVASTGAPDIYADLDFYLWLLEQQGDAEDDVPNG